MTPAFRDVVELLKPCGIGFTEIYLPVNLSNLDRFPGTGGFVGCINRFH